MMKVSTMKRTDSEVESFLTANHLILRENGISLQGTCCKLLVFILKVYTLHAVRQISLNLSMALVPHSPTPYMTSEMV